MMQEVRKIVQRQQQERNQAEDEDDDDDDDDEENNDGGYEIDEEVALNTESNIRLSRPSFSHQLPVPDQNSKNRTSAIRFRKGYLKL